MTLKTEELFSRYQNAQIVIHRLNKPEEKFLLKRQKLSKDLGVLYNRDFLYDIDSFNHPASKKWLKHYKPMKSLYVVLPLSQGYKPKKDENRPFIPSGIIFAPSIEDVLSAIPKKDFYDANAIEIFWPQEIEAPDKATIANLAPDKNSCITIIQLYKYHKNWWQKFCEFLDTN